MMACLVFLFCIGVALLGVHLLHRQVEREKGEWDEAHPDNPTRWSS